VPWQSAPGSWRRSRRTSSSAPSPANSWRSGA
jgi:hypothetical protein